MGNIAVVSSILVKRDQAGKAKSASPSKFGPAGKWPPAVSSLELIRLHGQAPSIPRAVSGNRRYKLWVPVTERTLPLIYLGSSFPIWYTLSVCDSFEISSTPVCFTIICFVFVLVSQNRTNKIRKRPKNHKMILLRAMFSILFFLFVFMMKLIILFTSQNFDAHFLAVILWYFRLVLLLIC